MYKLFLVYIIRYYILSILFIVLFVLLIVIDCYYLLIYMCMYVHLTWLFRLILILYLFILFVYSFIYYVNYVLTTYNHTSLIPSGYPLGGYDSTPYFFRCSRWEKNKKTLFHSTLFISFISKFVHNHNLCYNLLER